MQAEAGYLSFTGEPDGPPSRFGLSIVDMMTGADRGVRAGVRRAGRAADRARHGRRREPVRHRRCRTSSYLATWYLNAGHVQGRETRSAHPSLTPSQLYRTKDGWMFLMCNKEKFWPILCEKIDRPDWITDARFARFKDRLANRASLTVELDGVLSVRTTAEWLDLFGGTVPAAPVYDVGQALDNPFVRDTGRVASYERHDGGTVTMLTGAVRVNGQGAPCRAAPALGADNATVFARIGVDDEAVDELRRRGVV